MRIETLRPAVPYAATLLFAVWSLISCGNIDVGATGRAVGAACSADEDCVQHCLINDRHFPGGMCTTSCASNADCPSGSVCLAEEGGVCVVSCRTDADCADFGRGFACDGEEQISGGDAMICRIP